MKLLQSSKMIIQQVQRRVVSSTVTRNATSLMDGLEGQSEAVTQCIALEDKYGAHNYHPVRSIIFKCFVSKYKHFTIPLTYLKKIGPSFS